jgi:hypothetical protein
MKSFLIFSLLAFSCSLVFAQHDSGKATFHVKHDIDKDKRISNVEFINGCGEKYRRIFIYKDGNAYFFWGRNKNPTSVSFSSDTLAIDSVRSIITLDFVNKLQSCSNKSSISSCIYGASISGNEGDSFVVIEVDEANSDKCTSSGLQSLVKLLDIFEKRYAFPKQ